MVDFVKNCLLLTCTAFFLCSTWCGMLSSLCKDAVCWILSIEGFPFEDLQGQQWGNCSCPWIWFSFILSHMHLANWQFYGQFACIAKAQMYRTKQKPCVQLQVWMLTVVICKNKLDIHSRQSWTWSRDYLKCKNYKLYAWLQLKALTPPPPKKKKRGGECVFFWFVGLFLTCFF